MKIFFLLWMFLTSFFSLSIKAQETIYQGDFKGEYKLAGGFTTMETFSKENKILLYKMKGLTIPTLITLDENGKLTDLNIKMDAYISESSTGKTKVLAFGKTNIKKILTEDGKKLEFGIDFFKKINSDCFKSSNFNDSYIVGLGDGKGDGKVNLNKEAFYLHLYNFKQKKFTKAVMQLPNIERVSNGKKNIAFSVFNLDNNGFDFVTKAISKDYKKCSIYLTRYNFEGKIISEKEFQIDGTSFFLLPSNNGAGQMDYVQTSPAGKDIYNFDDDLFINNLFFDNELGEIYVYGLYGKEAINDINDKVKPNGYYIYKFSSDGKLLWKKFNEVNNKEFNSSSYPFIMDSYLTKINDKICFITSADRLKHYFFYSVFDKNNGDVISQNEILSKNKLKLKYFQTQFLYGGYKLEEFPKKLINGTVIATMYTNPKILDYIKSVINKKDVIFSIVNFKEISILIETDNSKYFKFIKFKA